MSTLSTRRRPSWYKPDAGLAARMVLTMVLLGAVYVVFVVVLRFALGGVSWIALAFLAVVIAGIQLFFADKIALVSMRARLVSEQEAPELHDMVGRLAAQANLPKPQIALVQSTVPNAFATGRSKNHAVIAVTSALCNQLSAPELEAVLAHELSHIINRDMLVMTIATFFSMVASLLIQNLFWFGGGYGRRRDNGENNFAIVLLASLVTYLLSFLLIRALSRYRELAADRGSALITGAPEHLATALMHVDALVNGPQGVAIPQTDIRRAQTVSALCIVPVLRSNGLAHIVSTHPSLQVRLEQLQRMQRQMEAMPAAIG